MDSNEKMPWKIRIRVSHHVPSSTVALPAGLGQTLLHGSPRRSVAMDMGNSRTYIHVKQVAANERSLLISPDLHEQWSLKGKRMWLKVDARGNMRLAPILAILTSQVHHAFGGLWFGPSTDYFREICRKAPRFGVWVYLVHPEVLLQGLQSGRVAKHWEWSAGVGWRESRKPVPLPDIVYDRIGSRQLDQSEVVLRLRESLRANCWSTYFNPGFFNKWEVYEFLSRVRELENHLPWTQPSNETAWRAMASRAKVFYIKPISGSKGRGIVRVTRRGDQLWSYFLMGRRKGPRRGLIRGLQNLLDFQMEHFPEDRFIVQKGIHLARINGCPYDLRILLQKGKHGQWKIASKIARVAASRSSLTNLSRGGRSCSWEIAFINSGLASSRRGAQHLIGRGSRLALLVADGLQSKLNAQLGELGVDLAVDRTGKFWVLEVNAKPGHQLPDGEQPRYRSVKHLLQYCLHLAGCER